MDNETGVASGFLTGTDLKWECKFNAFFIRGVSESSGIDDKFPDGVHDIYRWLPYL
jgi:hypothetical protein